LKFVDILIRVNLEFFGQGHQALGANAMSQFFDEIFSGIKPYESLEPLIGFYRCWFQSYDLKTTN